MDSFGSRWRSGLTRLSFSLLLTASGLQAQPATGEILIQVKDPSGAVIDEASGTLRNLGTGAKLSFRTDAHGSFDFANLPYGRYKIEVSKSGFAPQSVEIDVQIATPVSRTITLRLA